MKAIIAVVVLLAAIGLVADASVLQKQPNFGTNLNDALESMRVGLYWYCSSPVGSKTAVLVELSKDSGKGYNTAYALDLLIFDASGRLLSSTIVYPEGETSMLDPSMAVAPNENIYVFWNNPSLCCAIVSSKGETISSAKTISGNYPEWPKFGTCEHECKVGGQFLASFYKGKIIGIANSCVAPTDLEIPSISWIVIDEKLRVANFVRQENMAAYVGDAITVDDSGRTHVTYERDSSIKLDRGKWNICYAVFDPMGQLEEKKLVAQAEARQWLPRPAKGITLDPEGTVHIYYVDRGVKHVTIKGKTPAKGKRVPIILTGPFIRINADDTVERFPHSKSKSKAINTHQKPKSTTNYSTTPKG